MIGISRLLDASNYDVNMIYIKNRTTYSEFELNAPIIYMYMYTTPRLESITILNDNKINCLVFRRRPGENIA